MKNNKGQIDFDTETIFAGILALASAFLSLIVMKGSGLGGFWKIATFLCTAVAAFFVMKFIINK